MGGRRSYIVFRKDLLVVRTKPVTERRARWLLEEAYYKVPSIELRKRYLSQWGNVLDLTGEGWIERWGLQLDLPGVYESEEELAAMILEAARSSGPTADPAALRRGLEELWRALGEFLRRPVEPRRLERRPRQQPALRYVVLWDFPHVRWSELRRVEYLVPEPEWHARLRTDYADYGISVFRNTFWLWRQEGGSDNTEVVIVRRGATLEELEPALLGNGDASQFLRRYGGLFAGLVRRREAEMKRRGYEDVARIVEYLATSGALAPASRSREEEGEGVPA